MEYVLGSNNRALEIDLSTQSYREFHISKKERELFLGAKGLALKYVIMKCDFNSKPLEPGNVLAIFTGVLLGTGAPGSARFSSATRSPLTGLLTSSSCGGNFGYALKTAGWDGIIIKGKAKRPTYITINNVGVEFSSAEKLWGKEIKAVEQELGGKSKGTLIIGPAGENRVLFANIASGNRFLGRGGQGAVMGSKNLKAIVAEGGFYKILPFNEEKFNKVKKKAVKYLKRNVFVQKYSRFGTNTNILMSNKSGILPVRNFTKGMSDKAELVSGERISTKHNTKKDGCRFCTIVCGHNGNYDSKVLHVPEYETNSLFGPNLEIYDTKLIAEWNEICEQMGIDTISAAVTIAYVMEATEKGLIQTELKFGDPSNISKTLYDIVHRENLGDELANGTKWLSEKYGGKEFAIHVKGLEMAGYDPRGAWGQGLSYAVANRGACHLSSALFFTESYFGYLKNHSTRAKAEFVKFFEDLYAAINSLELCIFDSFGFILETPLVKYTPKLVLKTVMRYVPKLALGLIDASLFSKLYRYASGIELDQKKMLLAGERITVMERYVNTQLGVNKKEDTLPSRFLKEGRICDAKKYTVPINKMLERYYKLRGYDNEGIPTKAVLEKLELYDLIKVKNLKSIV